MIKKIIKENYNNFSKIENDNFKLVFFDFIENANDETLLIIHNLINVLISSSSLKEEEIKKNIKNHLSKTGLKINFIHQIKDLF